MSEIAETGFQFGSAVTNSMTSILMAEDIQPGTEPSYQLCKELYLHHPLGAKMVETPIKIAQSQKRIITIDESPEKEVREAFEKEWEALKADYTIRGLMYTTRIYGVGSVIMGITDEASDTPLDVKDIWKKEIFFNILDPLNTAGSLVLDQDPNSKLFQKHGDITAAGQVYHRSRAIVMFNEQPIFIAYSSSAFGFSGRSVYQRALYPLKSFIQSMVTDDMVTTKAGLLIAKMKSAGSIINAIMQGAAAIKRTLLRQGKTNNVLTIDPSEDIESLNMQNTDTAMTTARTNIIKNIATAGDMPAQILEQESFAEGFGEGTEDTKNIVRYVNGTRDEMKPAYQFFDKIVQHRAWSPEFFEGLKAAYPEMYEGRKYEEVFYEWQKNFRAEWPSLLEEPDSEKSKQEKVKLEGLVSVFDMIAPAADPENKARLIQWVQDNLNEYKTLYRVALDLDIEALANYVPPQPALGSDGEGGAQGKPTLALRAVK